MRLCHTYKCPSNAYLINKPYVDCARPNAWIDERDWGRGITGSFTLGFNCFNSLNHLFLRPEECDYTETYTSWDMTKWGWTACVFAFMNKFVDDIHDGCVYYHNPRTRWAHHVVFFAGFTRICLAATVSCFGCFYLYEWLYTYAPFFRLKDASVRGWQQPWKEGQSTFLARYAAMVPVVAGILIWSGRWKRIRLFATGAMMFAFWFELGRVLSFEPSKAALKHNNLSRFMEPERRIGTLVPDLGRNIDSDNGMPFFATNFPNIHLGQGQMQDVTTENAPFDCLPVSRRNKVIPNPWFNWQKAPQEYRDRPFMYKNDLWELPDVLSARMRAGAME